MKKIFIILPIFLLTTICQAQKKRTHVSYMVIGKKVYEQHCMTCHQADGSGAQNMIPPLINTDYVLGDRETIIGIVLHGLNGELKVNGITYGNEMPSQNKLTDREIAAVLTYVRKSFGNKASLVRIADVKRIRAQKVVESGSK